MREVLALKLELLGELLGLAQTGSVRAYGVLRVKPGRKLIIYRHRLLEVEAEVFRTYLAEQIPNAAASRFGAG